MDYTEIFKRAIENKDKYDFENICKIIESNGDFKCGDWDDWADNYWYLLRPSWVVSYDKCYGFLCKKYPVALLTKYCPEKLSHLFDEQRILYENLEEPMSCDETVLKQYYHGQMIIDESFVDTCNYDFNDERFLMLIHRLETGQKSYLDSSYFMMKEIR